MFTHEEIPSSGGKWITLYMRVFFSCCFMIFGKRVNASGVLGLSSGNREKCCPCIFHVLNYGASRPFWSQPSNCESPRTYSFTKRQLTSTTNRPNSVVPHTWSISAQGEMPNKKKNLCGYRSIRRVTLSGCCSNLLYASDCFLFFSLPVAEFPSTVIGMFAVWARMSSCQSEWALSQQQETRRFKRNEAPTLINEKPRWGIFRSNLRQEALLELETHTPKKLSVCL